MKLSFTAAILLLTALLLSAPATLLAETCDLPLKVFDLGTDKEIPGANISARDLDTKAPKDVVFKDGVPYLTGAKDGELFRFDVTKPGFKHTVDFKMAVCIKIDDKGMLPLALNMQKGSPKQLFSFYGVYTEQQYYEFLKTPPMSTDGANAGEGSGIPGPSANKTSAEKAESMQTDSSPKIISAGEVNAKAVKMPAPDYPLSARAVGALGTVRVQVIIDENGDVISATALSGHPLLRGAAVEAARKAKFQPSLIDGPPVRVSGILVYRFQ